MSKKPQLFALLVGINNYPPPVPPLAGCLNDLSQMETFLKEELQGFLPHVLALRNEQATKAAIVEGFEKHLAQADSGDAVLFYFSGHGTQEEADTQLWRFEADKKLEALVGYDGIVEKDGQTRFNLLADKELRYLLHRLGRKGAHILTIFDCCHSGGNTRNSYLIEGQEVRERQYRPQRLSQACPVRPWEQFIFAKDISPEALKTKPLAEVLPVGRHIQLAACQSSESAYEHGGRGAFSTGLLHFLRSSGGRISYHSLASRLRFLLKQQFAQSPQLYAGQEASDPFQGFLGLPVEEDRLAGNVICNPKLGWILDLGALHGLNGSIRQVSLQLEGKDTGIRAALAGIEPSYSRLELSSGQEAQLQPEKGYTGVVEGGLLSKPLLIGLEGEAEGTTLVRAEIQKENSIRPAEQGGAADYSVYARRGRYLITTAHKPEQPLTKPIEGYSPASALMLRNYLKHIARWEFVKELHNPDSRLFDGYPVSIEFFKVEKDGQLAALPIENDEVKTTYEQADGKWAGNIRIRISNRHRSRLFVSLAFLSLNFQVFPRLLGEPVIALEAGASAWAFEGANISLDFPQQVADFQWPYSPAYFQLIASTQEFDPSRFEQPPLPAPGAADIEPVRSIQLGEAFRYVANDWITHMVTLKVKNPLL